jgi:hypothetical protein
MSTVGTPQQILYADQEHGGLRTAVFISLFFALWIAFQLLTSLLPELLPRSFTDYSVFLSCVGAIPLALLMVWGVETVLKRVWRSGLSLALDETGLYVEDRRARQAALASEDASTPELPAFQWAKPLRLTNWHFRMGNFPRGGRERRIAPTWLCLAIELLQDDSRLIVFTFAPPQKATEIISNAQGALAFHGIAPAELYSNTFRERLGPPSRPTIPNQLLHSKEGRYWLAERRRWEQGIELTIQDFETLLGYIQRYQHSTPAQANENDYTDESRF